MFSRLKKLGKLGPISKRKFVKGLLCSASVMFKESQVKLSTRVALSIIIEETRCNKIEVLQKATGGS